MGHHQAVTPHCITHYRLWADEQMISEVEHNHHSVCEHHLPAPIMAHEVKLEILATAGRRPAVYALHVR